MRALRWLLIVSAFLVSSQASTQAQETAAKPADEMTVVVTGASDAAFPEITVDFEVKRPDGSFLLDATKADFKITEEGRDVAIKGFEAPTSVESRPTTIVLVVDKSGSMARDNKIGGLKRAVASFLDGLPKGSRVGVVAFASDVRLICPLTTDFAQVQSTVEELTPDGGTRFYDGVRNALEVLSEEQGRRAVLAMTDGMDTASQQASIPTLITEARRLGLPIHTLGFGSEHELAGESLKNLAESTRGQYYTAQEADKLRLIYEEIARRLRSSLSDRPQNPRRHTSTGSGHVSRKSVGGRERGIHSRNGRARARLAVALRRFDLRSRFHHAITPSRHRRQVLARRRIALRDRIGLSIRIEFRRLRTLLQRQPHLEASPLTRVREPTDIATACRDESGCSWQAHS